MRLTRIKISGYKRLQDTACNVDGKLIAFLGPNESGKSSVLQALEWYTNGKDTALPVDILTREAEVPSDQEVVTASFTLEESDRAHIDGIATETTPSRLHVSRTAAGQRKYWVTPAPKRPPEPFASAARLAMEARAIATTLWTESSTLETLERTADRFLEIAEDPDSATIPLHDADLTALEEALKSSDDDTLLRSVDPETRDSQLQLVNTSERLLLQLGELREIMDSPHPSELIRKALISLSPEFLMFSDADRNLASYYNLQDESLRADPPRSLKNLLHIAGTTLERIAKLYDSGQVSARRTHQRQCNERLDAAFRPAWRQAELSVNINIEGHLLQIEIKEFDEHGGVVTFSERSDGFRIYVALTCFLLAERPEHPVILLIDEAEQHLHMDAQADLIRALERTKQVSQVIYTTHSPACLPQDLGTGIRLVEPDLDNGNLSYLRNNFWDSHVPGYSAILYAMGAGAAAFSACRAAVIGEGPAEMILLPSLIKCATSRASLPYQVAPGLSAYAGDLRDFEFEAARVVYLVDGDSGGKKLKTRLTAEGVSAERVLQLPHGFTLEDLIDPQHYLSAVMEVVRDTGIELESPTINDLDADGPIAKRVDRWLEARSISPPGKVAVAAHIVRSEIALSETAADILVRLHADILHQLALQ